MSAEYTFSRAGLDDSLKALGKEFKKRNGKGAVAEIVLVGGAAVLLNYGFRGMTTDVDAVIRTNATMKDAVNKVGDDLGLPNNWLNTDFCRTSSYSDKLAEVSKHYKTFANVLQVRTVYAEYLVAMKLMAGRRYKHDLSDIVGVLWEHWKSGDFISGKRIEKAVAVLYARPLPEKSKQFLNDVLNHGDYEGLYTKMREMEEQNKEILPVFQEGYPGMLNESNIDDVLNQARKKKETIRKQTSE